MGKSFRVWVDRVTPSQIGSDTWVVKFDKWELSGNHFVCFISKWRWIFACLCLFIPLYISHISFSMNA